MNILAWLSASRPRTLPLALSCVLMGGAVALASGLDSNGEARFWPVLAGAAITVALLQVTANYANDYGDFAKGTDVAADREDRAIASGSISPQSMKRAVQVSAALSFMCGILTLMLAFVPGLLPGTEGSSYDGATIAGLGIAGVAAIFAAIRYTMGTKPYGYQGLGDLFVLVFFGFVGVLGVGLLVSHEIHWTWVLPACFSGCMSVAVLNLNNLRDHESDKLAGKNTLVVKLGFDKAKAYHLLMLATGWCALGMFFAAPWQSEAIAWRGVLWYALIALVHVRHAAFVWRCDQPAELDPELRRIALSTFVVALFMFLDQTTTA